MYLWHWHLGTDKIKKNYVHVRTFSKNSKISTMYNLLEISYNKLQLTQVFLVFVIGH